VRKCLLSIVKALQQGEDPPHLVRDPQSNRFPHIDCFAYLLPQSMPWRERFDYLAGSAQKENPAAFQTRQKFAS